jgi:hypothetical protein
VVTGTDYGNDVEFPDVSSATAGYLVGGSVTVPVASMLTHLGVINKAAGPNIVLALYSDLGGLPDVLVASTPPTLMTLGRMEIPVAVTPLAPGTYWLMGVYDTDTSMGVDSSDPSAPVRYIAQAFASPLPNPFPPAAYYSGQRFNYYLKVD